MAHRKAVATRVDPEVRREIQALMKHYKWEQSELLRRALARGLREMRVELGVRELGEGGASLARAAGLAGMSIFDFLDELQKRRIPVGEVSLEDALQDVAAVKAWTS